MGKRGVTGFTGDPFNPINTGYSPTDIGTYTTTRFSSTNTKTVRSGTRTGSSQSTGTAATVGAGGSAQKSSNGLSGGAIAGIAIGAIFGLAFVIGLLYLFLRQRNRKKHAAAGRGDVSQPVGSFGNDTMSSSGKPEMEGSAVPTGAWKNGSMPVVSKPELAAHPSVSKTHASASPVSSMGAYTNLTELGTSEGPNRPPPSYRTSGGQQSELPGSVYASPSELQATQSPNSAPIYPSPNNELPEVAAHQSGQQQSSWQHLTGPEMAPEVVSGPPAPPSTQLSANDEVRRLEEEARRIAAEIAEAERMQGLRQQQLAVEARLKEARERAASGAT
jgi:hypothetical protein